MTATTCSWCHTLSHTATCPGCGHRADLSRLSCDCQQCGGRRAYPECHCDEPLYQGCTVHQVFHDHGD